LSRVRRIVPEAARADGDLADVDLGDDSEIAA
jgi:hypothetical protein